MKKLKLTKLCALSLGLFLFCSSQALAEVTGNLQLQQTDTSQEILQQLAAANIVYLGETHDSLEDHQAQLKIITELYWQNGKVAIALEMFQRPFQSAIDQYLAGKITEAELIEQSQYNQRWGFPWEYYAPILRFAKENKLPVLALNTPTEVTRKVAREGLENLTAEEREYIPPASEIRTDNAEYRQIMLEIYQQHASGGLGSSAGFDRFFLAQNLWDETMAETVAQFVIAKPDYQVVVLAGKGHIVYNYGIPSRVARRLSTRKLIQRSVLFFSATDSSLPTGDRIADFIWKHAE
ncbi:ChaN family lipoprotein [Kamptonema sp. UHCC 0994]|uniref:ChaN family lipoprotein n=1 Tax=Kamptonema sp. UHCC 0994 TaxID=3031329 RepID=UPI0023B9688E|nr:ChaN family lipoprotein [Kamptonema sp. UHCC 0994]MDF0554120.1 ChaN family lipoprotein [Kamptonema sp. UHCC 0994]